MRHVAGTGDRHDSPQVPCGWPPQQRPRRLIGQRRQSGCPLRHEAARRSHDGERQRPRPSVLVGGSKQCGKPSPRSPCLRWSPFRLTPLHCPEICVITRTLMRRPMSSLTEFIVRRCVPHAPAPPCMKSASHQRCDGVPSWRAARRAIVPASRSTPAMPSKVSKPVCSIPV